MYRSLLSHYVLNRFWAWSVTLWPEWVAPNMVRVNQGFVTKKKEFTSICTVCLFGRLTDHAVWPDNRAAQFCDVAVLRSDVPGGEGRRDGPAELGVLYVRAHRPSSRGGAFALNH
jgi:hypothetical protein